MRIDMNSPPLALDPALSPSNGDSAGAPPKTPTRLAVGWSNSYAIEHDMPEPLGKASRPKAIGTMLKHAAAMPICLAWRIDCPEPRGSAEFSVKAPRWRYFGRAERAGPL
jgi:hypothetical protein